MEYENEHGECWVLVLNYVRAAGQQDLLDPSALPLNPHNGYSHRLLAELGIEPSEVVATRWYCTSSRHERTLHFRSTSQALIDLVVTGASSLLDVSECTDNTTTTLYADHSATLPFGATHSSRGAARVTGGLMALWHGITGLLRAWGHVILWGDGIHAWSMPSASSPEAGWECDESAHGQSAHATTHRVWVKLYPAPPPTPPSTPPEPPSAPPDSPPLAPPSTMRI